MSLRNIIIVLIAAVCWFSAGRVGASDTLRITLVGDVLLDRGVRRVIDSEGIDALFSHSIDSLFRQSDVVVANFECPATTRRTPQQKPFIFRAEPEWLPALARHGITHLNLANNHSVDQGREGLKDTYDNIRSVPPLTPVGAGHTMSEAARPVLLGSEPRAVWLLSSNRTTLENFAYLPDEFSISQQPDDSLTAHVSRLRQDDGAACIIVYLHWGLEHKTQPTLDQRILAHRLIDAGADIIVGHHPHCLQQQETYRGKPIVYSVGNFIFDQPRPLNSRAQAVTIELTADNVSVGIADVWIDECRPSLMTAE